MGDEWASACSPGERHQAHILVWFLVYLKPHTAAKNQAPGILSLGLEWAGGQPSLSAQPKTFRGMAFVTGKVSAGTEGLLAIGGRWC